MNQDEKLDWSREGAIARGKTRLARLDELSKIAGATLAETKAIASKAPAPLEAVRGSGYVKAKPAPEPIDWAYWVKLPEVKVFEAIALLFDTVPDSEPPDRDDASPEYRKTLRLLVACLSDRSTFTAGTLNMGNPALHGVRLSQVGTWALAHDYKIPDKFPRAIKPKELPEPIKTVGNTYIAPSRGARPANWQVWAHIPRAKLWEAICLTLDIEPDDERHGITWWLRERRGTPIGLPSDFVDRLRVAQSNVSTNGPIHPQRLQIGVLESPHCEVLLSEIAAFAIRCNWSIPEPLKSLFESPAPVATKAPMVVIVPATVAAIPLPAVAPSVAPKLEVVRTSPRFNMTKSAMIEAHEHEWPTIRADIGSAAENGLNAAKAGPRGWHEESALEWARAKGKLKNADTPAKLLTQAVNRMSDLPSKKHKQPR